MGPTREQKEKSRNNHDCCIPGCESKTGHVPHKFFRVLRSDQSLTEKWIETIKRCKISDEGDVWEPSSNTRICGKHFDGGMPSKSSSDPNAVPTLFLPMPILEDPEIPVTEAPVMIDVGVRNIIQFKFSYPIVITKLSPGIDFNLRPSFIKILVLIPFLAKFH